MLPPSMSITHTFGGSPLRVDMNATFEPSGDTAGSELRRLVSLVSGRAAPVGDPPGRTRCAQIWLLSARPANAIRRPSGDIDRPRTSRTPGIGMTSAWPPTPFAFLPTGTRRIIASPPAA